MDAIAFDDYAHDMEELSASAAGIIKQQRKEIDNWRMLAAALVLSAGGEIRVSEHLFGNPNMTLEKWEDPSDRVMVYRAKRG